MDDFPGSERATNTNAAVPKPFADESLAARIFEASPAATLLVDAAGKVTELNSEAARLFDRQRAALIDRPLSELIPQLDLTGHADPQQEHLALRGDGVAVPVEVALKPLPLGDQHYVIVALADISARKSADRYLRDSEALHRTLYQDAPVMMHSIDNNGVLLSVTQHWLTTLGYSRDEVLGRKSVEFLTEESQRYAVNEVLPAFFRTGRCNDVAYQMRAKDGSVHDVLLSASLQRDADGKPVKTLAVLEDVTERRRHSAALAEQHERLRVTLNSIGDAVVTTDTAGRVEYINPVAEQLTGWRAAEARGRAIEHIFKVVDEQTLARRDNPVDKCLHEGRAVPAAPNAVLLSRSGSEYSIDYSAAPIRDAGHCIIGVVLAFRDMTEQHQLIRECSYQATHDALTKLINRAEFERCLQQALSENRESQAEHSVMLIDLDHFKRINDACGHTVGDRLLRQVGTLIQTAVRTGDVVGRLGSDEFAVILQGCGREPARRVAQTLCDKIDAFRFSHEERRFHIGASIGLVAIERDWNDPGEVLQAADTACASAKEAGRNRVHAYADVGPRLQRRRGDADWASRIEDALDHDRFILFAQMIEPTRRQHHGLHCEILLRLRDESGAIIAPGAFMPAAERFHLASRIDKWVIHQVVTLLASDPWQLRDIDQVSINLSGQSLADAEFHRHVETLLDGCHFDLGKLCFEITETSAIGRIDQAAQFITTQRARGIRFSLDDFGSGVSSFGYLKSLPVDYLKVDGQFVKRIVEDRVDFMTVKCIADLGKALGKQTVAEFVETEAARGELEKLGVDYVQGYGVHKPEPFADVLSSWRRQAA